MKKEPLVTVVTVVWNDIEHIEETINSVLNQTYPNIEYIIIDGASSDGTWDVISNYSKQLSYSISEPDKGIYDAMNKAIRVAKGEWIIFMNSGDTFYEKEAIEKAFNGYEDQGESIVYGDFFVINHPLKGSYYEKAQAQTASKVVYDPSFHQAIFTRTKELKDHPFEIKYKLIADFAFFYDLYYRNHKWHYTNSIICNYDAMGLSATSRKRIMKENARFYFARSRVSKALFYYVVYLKRCITG